jgi:GT2 family glycosyltransferase
MTAAGAPGLAIALVVCTRDRAEWLPDTLRSLAALRSRHAWELALVDNASVDDTAAVLARFAAEAGGRAEPGGPGAVRVLSEPVPGLARARNAGVRATTAPLLCFTDDDCYPAPDFLDRWVEVFDDPEVSYGGGRIQLHDPQDYPITIRTNRLPDPVPPHAYVLAGLMQGANMAFRRSLLERLGGFDPGVGPGTPFNCEDVHTQARASAAGARGGYVPGPAVAHHHRRRTGREIEALVRSYTHGRGAYHASLLLDAESRKHGLWAWKELVVDTAGAGLDRRAWARAGGELLGGARYLAARAARALRRERR